MISFTTLALILFTQDTVLLKPKEEFAIKFELSVKQRPYSDPTGTVRYAETSGEHEKRTSTDLLPYLKLNVKIITVHTNEIKLKVFKDDGSAVFSKKTENGMEFKLDLGFTDDIKDRVTGYKYVIQFYTQEKEEFSKIVIEFDVEGNYFVNGEKRGRI
jgi:hypothetical protein